MLLLPMLIIESDRQVSTFYVFGYISDIQVFMILFISCKLQLNDYLYSFRNNGLMRVSRICNPTNKLYVEVYLDSN